MTRRKTKIALLVCAAAIVVFIAAMLCVRFEHRAHLKRIEGAWEGTLRIASQPLPRVQRMVLRIFKDERGYHAVMDEIDNGIKNLPGTKFEASSSEVNFQSGSSFNFQGKLDEHATKITGHWRWTGVKTAFPLTLTRTNLPDKVQEPLAETDCAPGPGSDLQGFWKGTLNIPGNPLRLHLKIAQQDDGTFRAELDSIDQPPIIPLTATAVEFKKPSVKLSFQGIGAAFQGQLSADDSQMVGSWIQGGTTPLTLSRADWKEEMAALDAGKNFASDNDGQLQGHWTGSLSGRYGLHLHLVFNIGQLSDGSFAATLDSPDQLLFAMPFDNVVFTPPKVHLEMKAANCVFDGKLSAGKLDGTWNYKFNSKASTEPLRLERQRGQPA